MKKKYFLGSVGTAEAFKIVNGKPVLAFRSKTLTDSGLNISTTKDDIRAGTGAPIQFSFYHDPNIEITLTDVLFDEAYITAQLGAEFKTGGVAYANETIVAADNKLTLKDTPEAMPMGCGQSATYVWYTLQGADDWKVVVAEGKEVTAADIVTGSTYCVRYLAQNDAAHIAQITTDMMPEELRLVITAPIYAGDACSASNGKAAGTITFEIPRFKLAGAQDFAFNMSQNQTMSLSGNVLASDAGTCDTIGSNLIRIIAEYNGANWYDGLTELVADEDYLKTTDAPHIYGVYENGTTSLINNDNLVFAPALQGGKWGQAGEVTITIEGSSVTDTVTIA